MKKFIYLWSVVLSVQVWRAQQIDRIKKAEHYWFNESSVTTVENYNTVLNTYSNTSYQKDLLKNSQTQNHLTISPNPSYGIFTLCYKSDAPALLNIRVFNALGIVIWTKAIKNFSGELNETVDLTGFAKGLYILEFSHAKVREVRNVIVE